MGRVNFGHPAPLCWPPWLVSSAEVSSGLNSSKFAEGRLAESVGSIMMVEYYTFLRGRVGGYNAFGKHL
jgi:hypothetical protein